ncbi:MAG: hypothetical protein ABIJ39_13530 [Chloroflexota bacterium]
MDIIQIDPLEKRQRREFLAVPFRIYAATPQWVPPLEMDARRMLDPRRNPFYRHSAAAFFLAWRHGRAVGRLAVLDHRKFNEYNNTATAFFHLFECENDREAANCLFEQGFAWARARGLTEMTGPRGFTPLDGSGLLVEGFEYRPAYGLPYNLPYYPGLIEALGFEPGNDIVSGYISPDMDFPVRIHALAEKLRLRRGLSIAQCTTRKELRGLVRHLKTLYNESLEGTSATYPLTDQELDAITGQMIWLADPRLVKIVLRDEQPVGFLLAYPDVSAALQKTRGRLWPLGWLAILRELRRTEWININGAGLKPEYRGSGGTAILYSELFKSVTENPRYRQAEVVQIGAENDPMQREMANFGVAFCKTHRLYLKKL